MSLFCTNLTNIVRLENYAKTISFSSSSVPSMKPQVMTDVLETPRMPWRFRLWPVRSKFGSGVRGERKVVNGLW